MKVKDLLKKLQSVNQNLDVYTISNSGIYEIVNFAQADNLTIVDGDGFSGKNPKEKQVFIISNNEN